MTEKQVEQKLVKAVKTCGGHCINWVASGWNGAPDRIVLLPGGRIGFVEVKRPGQKPRAIQTVRHRELRELGFDVFVLDEPGQIPGIIRQIRGIDDVRSDTAVGKSRQSHHRHGSQGLPSGIQGTEKESAEYEGHC